MVGTILNGIREQSTCPVIMLTAALTDIDYRLSGFKSGADDYIAKPFVADEVVARVQAVFTPRSVSDLAEESIEHRKFGSFRLIFNLIKLN